VIKPAYSVSFLLSLNIFVRRNVLYFPKDLRSMAPYWDWYHEFSHFAICSNWWTDL